VADAVDETVLAAQQRLGNRAGHRQFERADVGGGQVMSGRSGSGPAPRSSSCSALAPAASAKAVSSQAGVRWDSIRGSRISVAYRVRLRGSGGLEPALAALGRRSEPTSDGRGYVVEVASEQDTEKLLADLVRAGVGLRECVAADNPLEDVYRQLLGREGADDGTPDTHT